MTAGARGFSAAYAGLYRANLALFLCAHVSLFVFGFFNLSSFAPGSVTMPRIIHALLGFFGALLSAFSSSILACCTPAVDCPADQEQLISYVLLNSISVLAYAAASALMLHARASGVQSGGLLEWSIAIAIVDIGLALLCSAKAFAHARGPHGGRVRDPAPQCEPPEGSAMHRMAMF